MHEIVTSVEIAAAPARVWQALSDFPAYRRWNPVIRKISGPLVPGGVLSVLFRPRGSLAVWFRAMLTVVQPEVEFRWTGKMIATALFSGDHYFILRPLAPDRTELTQGEVFKGALAPIMYRLLAGYNRAGFLEMNAALKAYLEGEAAPTGCTLVQAPSAEGPRAG
ncbi:MAG: SRPBCC domain-containing protein [Betaproteobacteria bacterium]|nr:MAG: SRPBCC domain-containing protein [Betaproteobacteria bacterium]